MARIRKKNRTPSSSSSVESVQSVARTPVFGENHPALCAFASWRLCVELPPKLTFAAGVLTTSHYSLCMKHGERILFCAVAGLALGMTAYAATSDSPGSPYQGIVERNVF